VPQSDKVVLNGAGGYDVAKTDLYREELGQAPISSQSDKTSDPQMYCRNLVAIQTPFLAANSTLLATGQSPVTSAGDNLLTFMASQLSTSFASLGCGHFGLANPVTLSRNRAGVAVAAAFSTAGT
jgi:hypothetical protein